MEGHHCCWTNINVVTPSTQQYEPVSLIKNFFRHKNYWMFPYTSLHRIFPGTTVNLQKTYAMLKKTTFWGTKQYRHRNLLNLHHLYILCAGPSGHAVYGRSPAETVGTNPIGGMDVCCECCVLSGRGLCDELITRPEESYWLWCVVCDLETSWMRKPWHTGGCCAKKKQTNTFYAIWLNENTVQY